VNAQQKVAAAVLVMLLAAVGYGLWTTSPAAGSVRAQRAAATAPAASAMPVIDQNTFLTAKRLARLATTAEEQPLAQSAVQLADHELDQAFSAEFRHIEAHPPVLSPEAAQIQEHLLSAQKEQDSDAQEVKRLSAALAQAADAAKPAIQDRLQLAQSQLELAEDEVQEANNDLLQAGGNVHQRIKMMQEEHDATERNAAAIPAAAAASPLGRLRGLVGQVREWYAVRDKRHALEDAQRHAADSAAQLAAERTQFATELAASKQGVPEFAERAARRTGGAGSAAGTATPAKAAAAKPAPAAQRSVADAHAELPWQSRIEQPSRDRSVPAITADAAVGEINPDVKPPVAEGQQPNIVSRWLGQSDTDPLNNPIFLTSPTPLAGPLPNGAAPISPIANKEDPDTNVSAAPPTQPLQPPAAGQFAAADLSSPTHSVQMLLAAILGALALAGVMGRAIFKFVGPRSPAKLKGRKRRGAIWKSADDGRTTSNAYSAADALSPRPDFPRDLDQVDDPGDSIAELLRDLSRNGRKGRKARQPSPT